MVYLHLLELSDSDSESKKIVFILNLREVFPIQYSKEKKWICLYKRIKVEELTKQRIEDIYWNLNFRRLPNIFEFDRFFLIQYGSKPWIFISKENGKLYSFPNSWDLKEIEHQASLVIRVLSSFDLVEGYRRKRVRRVS